jgi:hypothetical protein
MNKLRMRIGIISNATIFKKHFIDLQVRDLRENRLPVGCSVASPLNPPFWGTSEPLKVLQNGGFRGRIGVLFADL